MDPSEHPTWSRGTNECSVSPWRVTCGWGWHDIHRFQGEHWVHHDAFLAGELHDEITRWLGADVLGEVLAIVRAAGDRADFQAAWSDDRAMAERWRAVPIDAGLDRFAPHDEATSRLWSSHERADEARARGLHLERKRRSGEPYDVAGVLDDGDGAWHRTDDLLLRWRGPDGASEAPREGTGDALAALGFGRWIQIWRLARVGRRVVGVYWAHGADERSALRSVVRQRGLVELTPGAGVLARSTPD